MIPCLHTKNHCCKTCKMFYPDGEFCGQHQSAMHADDCCSYWRRRERRNDMATGSITHNVVIDTPEAGAALAEVMDKAELEEYRALCPLKELRKIAKLLDSGRLAIIPYRPEGKAYVIPPEYLVDQNSQISAGERVGFCAKYLIKMPDGTLRDFAIGDVGKTVFFSPRQAAAKLRALQKAAEES